MKTATLLERLNDLLNADRRHRKARRKHLHALLKDLKKRQKQLEEKRRHSEDDEKRKKLKREIETIYEQRRKGIRLYRELRQD